MGSGRSDRFVGAAIVAAALVAAGLIAWRPEYSLPVLACAELIAAVACARMVRTTLRRTPPAPVAAAFLAGLALFWASIAVLSAYWYSRGQ